MWNLNSIWLYDELDNQEKSWEQIIWETRDLVDSRLHMKFI